MLAAVLQLAESDVVYLRNLPPIYVDPSAEMPGVVLVGEVFRLADGQRVAVRAKQRVTTALAIKNASTPWREMLLSRVRAALRQARSEARAGNVKPYLRRLD